MNVMGAAVGKILLGGAGRGFLARRLATRVATRHVGQRAVGRMIGRGLSSSTSTSLLPWTSRVARAQRHPGIYQSANRAEQISMHSLRHTPAQSFQSLRGNATLRQMPDRASLHRTESLGPASSRSSSGPPTLTRNSSQSTLEYSNGRGYRRPVTLSRHLAANPDELGYIRQSSVYSRRSLASTVRNTRLQIGAVAKKPGWFKKNWKTVALTGASMAVPAAEGGTIAAVQDMNATAREKELLNSLKSSTSEPMQGVGSYGGYGSGSYGGGYGVTYAPLAQTLDFKQRKKRKVKFSEPSAKRRKREVKRQKREEKAQKKEQSKHKRRSKKSKKRRVF